MNPRSTSKMTICAALLFGLTAWGGQVLAGPNLAVPQGPPVWCFGLNEFDRCVLYLGSAETCKNLAPCLDTSVGLPPDTGLTFCFGADDVTGDCRVFLGTREACSSLDPCRAVNGQLPRAPVLRR
jgi:hypothetical protein